MQRCRAPVLLLLLSGLACASVFGPVFTPALAQDQVVTSSAPDAVAVTIYRATDRKPDRAMRLDRLGGYALITEQRTVDLPAGGAVIRFEGVAGGMLPESALVTGPPGSVREKNLDADLLSPRSLYARSHGRPVTLRRRHPETGEVREEPAIVRSGVEGGVIVQADAGHEAANCGPLDEALSYAGVPEGLSARPTLSVRMEADAPARVTVSLSYLAWGFDWKASYVFHMHESGRKADVLAWVTLANSDPTSFTEAAAAVVGGTVNRIDEQDYSRRIATEELVFQCFYRSAPAGSPYAPAPMMAREESFDIVLTAQRVASPAAPPAVTVTEEQLGDLKLYRVPVATTVASKAQKQVALFQRGDVGVATVYTADIAQAGAPRVIQNLRMSNRRQDGLGISLPAGSVTVFEPHDGQWVLSGEGALGDAAVGQKVEVGLGDATQVSLRVEEVEKGGPEAGSGPRDERSGRRWSIYEAWVANAHPWPIAFEGRLDSLGRRGATISELRGQKLAREDGAPVWKTKVPANGMRMLRYRVEYD